jgi:hypothetical protein
MGSGCPSTTWGPGMIAALVGYRDAVYVVRLRWTDRDLAELAA